MSGLQVALSLYKREVEPMPEKVGHAKKCGSLHMKKKNYTHLYLQGIGYSH